MAKDVKGITWVGSIYEKFENMCLEVEDAMFEETVKYIENQMQTVGESVKKLYSDVMQDLLPPSSSDLDETAASELPIEQYTDAGFSKKSFQGSKKITMKADSEQTTEDSRINLDADNDVICAESCDNDALFVSASGNSVKGNKLISHARQYVGSTCIKSNLDSGENQQNKSMPDSKAYSEITLLETDVCSTSQSCELSDVNQNHEASASKLPSAKVTSLASVADCCNEIECASTEQNPNILVLVKSAEEKENMSSSSSFLSGDPYGFSMVSTTQPDDCSHNTIVVSHPEFPDTWSLDIAKIDTIEQGHKTMQQDDELKLEETCVMVSIDELQLVPKEGVKSKTSKKKKQQPFSLFKMSARKQEYEELAILHGNNEKGKGDYMENLCPTFQEDQKKLLLPDIPESEWELL
ncbi:hypothetical protein SESBI_16646 [Sesbania bispinosa]|nr:hypothetical protein SESBI_16646 [Sesbania bispinosa]